MPAKGLEEGREGHTQSLPFSPCLGICLSGVSTSKATNVGVSVSTIWFVCTGVCMCAWQCLGVVTGEPVSPVCARGVFHIRVHV